MRIKLLDSFRGKKAGDVIDWPDPMAQILIAQKRAEVYVEKAAAETKQVEAAPVDKMQRKPVGKKRA